MADSEPGLEPGIERSDEFTVAPPLVTDVGGTIGTGVLSTPGMIGMMEGSASMLAYERLPEVRRPSASRSASSTSQRPRRVLSAGRARPCATA